ncbi:MAG: MATE family efflux transporter [Bacteroidales bacterium]|nr:MATE family efflux transporter [Bacteroidales bacterium]
MAQPISISEHFGYRKLLRFTVPSMVMMVFTSVYSIVDGMFVSNFVGKTAFAAINLIFPFLMVLGVLGYMLGTGGSALVAKMLGEGQKERANRVFSLLVVSGAASGVGFGLVGIVLLRQVSLLLGADEAMVGLCVEYGRIVLLALPFFILQYMFQSLMVTAERPRMGMWVTVAAGLMNIVLDFVLIVVLGMGLRGAALATAMSQVTGGLVPVVYFLMPNGSPLRLVRPMMDWRALLQACTNGLSEFFGNVSGSVVSMCYNYQLMRYIGEDGVSAYGVIMYVQFIFFAVFLGYTIGSSPIVSYCHGAKNHAELHNIFARSLRIIGVMGVMLTIAMELLAWPLTKAFVGYDEALFELSRRAFMIYGLSYVLVGFNFYASAFFTALNNGVLSALLATVRALVFEVAAVFVLPMVLGADYIWFSVLFAEVMSLTLSAALLWANRKRYHY